MLKYYGKERSRLDGNESLRKIGYVWVISLYNLISDWKLTCPFFYLTGFSYYLNRYVTGNGAYYYYNLPTGLNWEQLMKNIKKTMDVSIVLLSSSSLFDDIPSVSDRITTSP